MSFISFETEQELIDEVKRKLGFPMVKVEIDDSQWKDIIKQTKRWFYAKKTIVSIKYRNYQADSGPILFSDIDPVNGVYEIIDVIPDSTDAGIRGEDNVYYEILPFGYPLWGSSTFAFGTTAYNRTSFIAQIFQSIEMRKRTYGSDLDWFVQKDFLDGHKLYLTPSRRSRCCAIVYKPKTLPIQALEGRDAQLVFDWAVAEAKETLGIIRSKYKDYPAAGGNISTDGQELLDAAKEAKEKLNEEIADSQGPMTPIFS